MKINEFQANKFKNWLSHRGCQVEPGTNEFEMVRWKGAEVGILYTTGKTNSFYAQNAIACWKTGRDWNGGVIAVGRSNSYKKQKKQILKRDGDACFYCGLKLRDDITLEHLIDLSKGGKNKLANMVLAHNECNGAVNGMGLSDKIKWAINKRQNI